MKINSIFCGICVVIACASCSDQGKTVEAASETRQENVLQEQQDSEVLTSELGSMEEHRYKGLLPAASCSGIEYQLLIRNHMHSGDGVFQLTLIYKGADNGKDKSFTVTGKRLTQRGIPGDDNATVWQCVSEDGTQIFNFLCQNENSLLLLNDKFEKPSTELNYSLTRIDSISN